MDWITAIKEIQKAQEDDRLVIFVGAGVSKNSGVPSWWELINKFGDELGYSRCDTCQKKVADCPKPDCKDRYEYTQEEFLRIPEYYYQQDTSEGHANYFGLIQSALHCDNGPNPINDEILSVFPRHIITTNYDPLLEKSQSVNSLLYTVVARDSDLLAEANDRYIIKMHGDLEKPDTIVLKESDYIKYEQEHPLICTFIKSLLVNHTFIFLGYSLNDNNLNLIIGWINYFRELHGVKERPANFWIDSKPAAPFEEARLENRNIYVVDLSSLPADLEGKAAVPSSITNATGQKFVNLCASLSQFKIKHWIEQIHSFIMILCLIDLDEVSVCSIFKALAEVVIEAAKSAPVMAEEIFDTVELAINHMSVKDNCVERTALLDSLLADEIYPILIERKNGSFERILRKFADEISLDVKSRIQRHTNEIEDVAQRVKQLYFFRPFYTKEFCISFFEEHFNYLSSGQCYRLLTDQIIPFDERCWSKFISTLEKQNAARKSQPGVRTFPDWLMATIEECIILKLVGFDIDLVSLEPYAHYSDHLSFILDPEAFDYSQVNTENYMWQNLIFSKEYQHYFIEHKGEVLSDDLRKSFDLGVATEAQQKIVYGVLLDSEELQRF